jgi:hypothetical protein
MRIFIKLSFLFCIASFGALAAPVFTGPAGLEVYVMSPQQKGCASGYYVSGPRTCKKAPAGYYVPIGTNATAPIPCPIGYYGPQAAAVTCIKAPMTTYVLTPAATAPSNCPSWTADQRLVALCWRPCPEGDDGYGRLNSEGGKSGYMLNCRVAAPIAGTTSGGAPGM